MIKRLSSVVLLLGLSFPFAASGADSPPIPESRGLPFFDHILSLFEQKVNNSVIFRYHTAMANPGVEAKATGSVDGKLNITRRIDNEIFTVALSNLLPTTVYQLNVFIGDNVNSTNATTITTDATGSFFAIYVFGRRVRGGVPMPSAMHPIHGLRELDVVNAKSQVVLRADLVDPDSLKYQATLRMHNPGFLPTASGSMRIRANPTNVELQLTAMNLRPLTDYMFLVNGITYKTVTSNLIGRMKFIVNDSTLDVFDIRTIALTDKAGINVVLVIFPGSDNGIIPAHNTVPAVVSTNPASGATGVPINATVNATFNEGMDPSTFTTSTFTLTQGASSFAGTVTYVNATATATFTPANNLSTNTTYTATITTGVADLGGNILPTAYSWNFTTSPTAVMPIVISTDPANLATGVAVNKQITATFNEAMNPATINTSTFLLMQTVSGTITTNGNVTFSGTTATFAAPSQLLPNTSYTATITTGAKDLAGNALVSNYSWSFTTGANIIPPTVTATVPANQATGVALNSQINATFSEAMDPTTINTATFTLVQTVSGVSSNGSVTYSGTTAAFMPPSNLSPNISYTATITTGAKDPSGNALASNFVWSFTTGTTVNTTPPTVISTVPANSATGVAINSKISATFSEAMDPSTLTTTTFTLMQGATAVSGTVTYAASGDTATFTPSTNLAPSTAFTATVTTGAKDVTGNALAANFTWSFTTGATADTTPPAVVSNVPANSATGVAINSKISATFSKAMDPSTITAATFTVMQGTTPVSGTVAYAATGSTATFTPSTNLATSTAFTATVTNGAKDLSGNALASNFVWTFTTGVSSDTTAPAATSTIPANSATGVAINSKLSATFSEAMDPSTITTATFTLMQGTTNISGTVAYAANSDTATFTPSTNLAPNTVFTATLTTGVKDVAGNALASSIVWTITTGAAADTTAPNVVSTNPINNATSIAINNSVNATFDKAMDPLTIDTANFTLAGPGANPISGTVSYDTVNKIAAFTPGSNLAPSTQFTATVTTGVKDMSGNALANNFVWIFTTGAQQALKPVALGAAAPFGSFGGGSGVTNQGILTVINGDIGTTGASTTVTGLHDSTGDIYTETGSNSGKVNGRIYTATPPPGGAGVGGNATTFAIATQAASDANTAFNNLSPASIPGGTDPGAGQLGGLTLFPGVYASAGATFQITGSDLTLDAQGNSNAVWVFQMASSLTVGAPGAPRSVILINGAQAKNVFWQVGSTATINAAGGGTMVGTIIASAGAAFSTAGNIAIVTLNGRALSLNASTTLVNTVINVPAP